MISNDRGENIVNLARELLRTEVPPPPEPSSLNFSMSFKALCFATLLAAFGSTAVTQWALENQRPMNHYERIELNALLYYTVHAKGLDEKNIRHEIENKLGIVDFDGMTRANYIIARRYLQNMAL